MTAEPVGQPERLFEVHVGRAIEPGGARERLRGNVEAKRSPALRDDREAATVHRDAVSDRDVGNVERAGRNDETQTVALWCNRSHLADGLDNSGKHQVSLCLTRACSLRSSPTRETSCHSRATRSARRASPPGNVATPRAGSPMMHGAR